jgi:hypothetical protein
MECEGSAKRKCVVLNGFNKLPRRKQRGIENLINFYYAASGGEFNPE